jgi:hypothetical protein
MPRWTHIVFGLVWLVTAFVFGSMAYYAHESESTKLSRFTFRIPKEYQMQIGSVRFQDVINGIADTHDKNVAALEDSIRQSSRTSFVLNVISCFTALVGFAAQVGEFFYERRRKDSQREDTESNPKPHVRTEDSTTGESDVQQPKTDCA